MGFKKYFEATTRSEKEKMIKYGQKGLEKYREFDFKIDNTKTKLPEDILNRLPNFWKRSVFKNKPVIYVEDFINHCKDKIVINKFAGREQRAIFVNGGSAYFTSLDSGLLHFILVVYLILIKVLPHNEDILNWHKQNDSISNEVMNHFIALDIMKNEEDEYLINFSGSYSPSSKRKLKSYVNKHEGYKNQLSKFGLSNLNIK